MKQIVEVKIKCPITGEEYYFLFEDKTLLPRDISLYERAIELTVERYGTTVAGGLIIHKYGELDITAKEVITDPMELLTDLERRAKENALNRLSGNEKQLLGLCSISYSKSVSGDEQIMPSL